MIVRYFVQFNYIDTEENKRVSSSVFVDMPRDIQSNEDLVELQERMTQSLINAKVKNFAKIHITDFRVEGIREDAPDPYIRKDSKKNKRN